MRTLAAALALVVSLSSGIAVAAPGDLDPSFGTAGEVAVPPIGGFVGTAIDPDGRIVVAGVAGFGPGVPVQPIVLRYDVNGTLDPTFGDGGVARLAVASNVTGFVAFALEPDGRLLVALARDVATDGTTLHTVAVVRLTTAGAIDPSFGDAGLVVGTPIATDVFPYHLLVQTDASFAVTRKTCDEDGHCTLVVDRFGADGAATATTNSDETVDESAVLQPDGRIVVAGRRSEADNTSRFPLVIARYDLRGRPDRAFGKGGRLVTEVDLSRFSAPKLAMTGNGALIVTGSNGTDMIVGRFLADGRPDSDFGFKGSTAVRGPASDTVGLGLVALPDGHIAVAGATGVFRVGADWIVAAFRADGTLDPDFGQDGLVVRTPGLLDDSATQIAVQPNGRLVVTGFADGGVRIARYLGFPRACGDADGDGTITVTDGVQVLRAAADLPGACLPDFCDLDASGAIGVSDGVQTLRAAAGLHADLHCQQ